MLRNCLEEFIPGGVNTIEFCKKLRIRQTTLKKIMAGKQDVSLIITLKIARELNQSVERLFWLETEENPFE